MIHQSITKIKNKSLWIIIALAIILRFTGINQSFWLDEAIGGLVAKNQSYSEILLQFPKGDNHPPLYYLTLKFWSDIFGYSELALRSLSVLFGALTICFIYKIAELKWKSNKIALSSALLLATSQFHIYYSQEARMYIMTGFFAAASIYFLLKASEQKQKKYWIFFSTSITCLIFTDYVPVLLLPVFWLYAIYKTNDKKWLSGFIMSHLPLAVLGLVWLPIFRFQQQAGAEFLQKLPAWKEIAGGATWKHLGLLWSKFAFGRISLHNKEIYYLLIIVFSIFIAISLAKAFRELIKDKLIWFWLIIPPLLGFVASFVFPLFIYFRFTFIIPAFYLLIARGVWLFKERNAIIMLIAILVCNLIGVTIYYLDNNQQREQWRQAVSYIEKSSDNDSIVIFTNPEPFAPYQWYSSGEVETLGALTSVQIKPSEVKDKVSKSITNKRRVYYLEYLEDLMDPDGIVENEIENNGFNVKSSRSFIGVGKVYLYEK